MIGSNADTYCEESSGNNLGGGLDGGGTNSGISSGSSTVKYVFGSFNIDYRSNSNQAWTPAVDLNGDICGGNNTSLNMSLIHI